MQASNDKLNLLGVPQATLEAFFAKHGEKPFRARQVMQWIHQRHAEDFDAMTDLSKKLRALLNEVATLELPRQISEQVSKDGTTKWLFESGAG